MGAKGSKQSLVSRFQPNDFFFGESAAFGMQAKPTAMHTIQMPLKGGGAAASVRLLAVGCEDGSVYVYGAEGIAVRLFEAAASDEPPQLQAPSAASDAPAAPAAASSSRVLFVSFLSPHALVSVHPHAVKLWSVASMMEVFALYTHDLPALEPSHPGGAAHYQFTAAALATEFESRYVWLGTAQGAVLLFDTRLQRLSQYVVPLLPEVQPAGAKLDSNAARASALAAAAAGLLPPTAVTCLAQLPTDSSQLLIGYASDVVLSWHISTRKLHRAYKRSGSGGVTALCWEQGPTHPSGSSVADHFAVGHRNGIINVWRRKYPHAPEATFFLSNAPGPRAPITRLRWSTRSTGFFVCGGHILPTAPAPASAPAPAPAPVDAASTGATAPASASVTVPSTAVDQGCVVFVSGAKFEHRKICATSMVLDAAGTPLPNYGIIDCEQILMMPPTAAAAPAAAANAPPPSPSAKVTPAFICVLASGAVSVVLPTISPAVPPLPLTDLHEAPADGVQLLSASSCAEEVASLHAVLASLRSIHPSYKLWGSLVRASLAKQHLWPLTGGLSSAQMAEIDAEEERLHDAIMQKLQVVSPKEDATIPTPDSSDQSAAGDSTDAAAPLPALLLTTHSGAAASIRLYDATSPFQLDLLCVLPLTRLMAPSARVTATLFCLARRELLVGTSTGELFLFRLRESTPPAAEPAPTRAEAGQSAEAPAPADAAAPSVASSLPDGAPAPASAAPPAAAAAVAPPSESAPSSAASVAPLEWTFELAHRLAFSTHPIHPTLLHSAEVDKYFVADEEGAFALLRPDTGVTVKQALPQAARISSAHFSSEALMQPKGPSLQSPQYLYVNGADGSVSLYCGAVEARLASIPSLSGEEARPGDAVTFMQTVSMRTEAGAQVVSPRSSKRATHGHAAASGGSGQSPDESTTTYVIACTNQSVKLLCAGHKTPESLLSLRMPEPIRLAFLVSSPHLIAQRDEVAPAAAASASATAGAPVTPAPPAPELCLGVVDAASTLHVLSVQLKSLLTAPLRLPPGALRPQSFSMSCDGRMASLPCGAALVLAQMFPAKQYRWLAPPPQLLAPLSDAELAASAAATAAARQEEAAALQNAPAPAASGWFASLLPVAPAHDVLFAPPLHTEEELEALASRKRRAAADPEHEEAEEETEPRQRPSAGAAATADASRKTAVAGRSASSSGVSGGSNESSQVRAARSQVGAAQDQMAQNKQLAADNLRRGQEVADKSELMANHAGDFLAAARKLRQQQESSWW